MLVLTRKPGQAISIGDSVEVYVVEVRGDQVRLSIRAPRSIPILRQEIVDQIRRENCEAATADPNQLQIVTAIVPSASPQANEIKSKKPLKFSR